MVSREKLVLFGGGPLPVEGLKKFVGWAAESGEPEILVVAWASEDAKRTTATLTRHFQRQGCEKVTASVSPVRTSSAKKIFLDQLQRATGVFFSGGDQTRVETVLRDPEIKSALIAAYESGIPFGGTSAGTAIMSALMITGDLDPGALIEGGVLTGSGLGLLGGTILDQHFLKRQRQNRLFALVGSNPHLLGVGVDEGAAVAIRGGRFAEVLGPERVMLVKAGESKNSFDVSLIESGTVVDLPIAFPMEATETQLATVG